jgi:nitrite reductase/ring-hydroxylating ferredoxin subunit
MGKKDFSSSQIMEQFTCIGHINEFASGALRSVPVGQAEVIVVCVAGKYFAFENVCPHQQYAVFHQGTINDYEITCPMHGWSFDVRSGEAIKGNGKLKTYNVEVRDNKLWVKRMEPDRSFPLF